MITRLPILLKQAEIGQEYFRTRFGAAASIAYNVDTFGHTAMLPAILRQHDFTAYVYGRGQEHLPSVFRWIAADGSEVVAHHARDGYGTPQAMSREQFFDRIRDHHEHGDEFQTFFYGIGDLFHRQSKLLTALSKKILIRHNTHLKHTILRERRFCKKKIAFAQNKFAETY